MKKVVILLGAIVVLLAGCGSKVEENTSASSGTEYSNEGVVPTNTPVPNSSGDEVKIGEKMFVEQVNDIYYNFDEYLGKRIKYEGIFEKYEFDDSAQNYSVVYRYGPGCCGDDGMVGFEVVWDKEYPPQDEWVEVAGVLVNNEEGGYQRLQLVLDELTVLPTRGMETVTQ